MIAAMRHRGPDDEGYRDDEHSALGMCRLAIIDVAGGRQPISTPDGRYHIVYNGECYDTAKLRRELEGRGCVFRTKTDTEVVLFAYAELGAEGLSRLNGMFAFAIWDSVERELFFARDRLGIKPLFYWDRQDSIVFSSTIGGICARGDFDRQLSSEGIELYLSTKYIPAPRTILQHVRKVPPGYWGRWRDGRLKLQQWWDVPLPRNGPLDIGEAQAVERTTSLLEDAARIRLVSERPVGLCLSGGIDSGLLAATLADAQLHTFSLGFEERDFDESHVAEQVARHVGLPHHVLMCNMDAERDFPAVVEHYDEPVSDSSGVALYNLSRLVAEHVTVALSGTGGDELFGGYLRYVGSRLARVVQYLPGLSLIPHLMGRDESKIGWRGRIARFAITGSVAPIRAYQRFLAPAPPDLSDRLRRPEFRARLGGFSASNVFREYFDKAHGCSLLTRIMYTDIKTTMVDDYLVKEDRMTMAHSIEGRVPFLDHRLVALAYSLPDRLKIRGFSTKRLLRRVARERLPAIVANAPKQGFEIPQVQWLRGPLAPLVRETLLAPDARIFEFVEPTVVHQIANDHLTDRANHSRILWALLTLETWLRSHA